MVRKIYTFGGLFEEYLKSLTPDQRKKVNYGLLLLKTLDRIPAKFVQHLEEGIYELRTEYEGTQKTPRYEIEKAKQLKKAYYERTNK